jgi:hypothetical protein
MDIELLVESLNDDGFMSCHRCIWSTRIANSVGEFWSMWTCAAASSRSARHSGSGVSCRLHRVPVRRTRHPREHRRVHPDDGTGHRRGGRRSSRNAVIILNPAEPPLVMRDTVLVLVHNPGGERQAAIRESVDHMVADVAAYVPGYRLKHELQISEVRRGGSPPHVRRHAPGHSPGDRLP